MSLLWLAVTEGYICVLTDGRDNLFVIAAGGSTVPRVLPVRVMACGCCISPYWPVPWPTTVVFDNVSQSVKA